MSFDVENIVIGAGVIGLAIARELSVAGKDVLVLEKNSHFGEETSSRNSEVIHAGIYYAKDSLKAKFCVEGKALLYKYCTDYSVPHARIGKLIVATDKDELHILDSIKHKAENNGVHDLSFLTAQEAHTMEPALNCSGALLSPSTGIIDTHQYMLSLVGEIESSGNFIAYNAPFDGAGAIENGFRVNSNGNEIKCKHLINAAGLGAQTVAGEIADLAPQFVPTRFLAKGSYFTMNAPSPFAHLIYPVPNTASLGIHVTLDMAGQIRFGPDQEWVDTIDYEMDADRDDAFYEAIRKYYPQLPDDVLIPAYTGIRPKLQNASNGVKDFLISDRSHHGLPGLVNLFGMESPGLTSSLSIAKYVCALLPSNQRN
ncbi:MAG: NAD(P)/FAD-dependent oxidoreductase [Sneathiella sp.]